MEMRAPVDSLRLRLEPADPVGSQRVLFGAGLRNRQRCGETLTNLRKLVGADRVGSPRASAGHRPARFERAPLLEELGDGISGTAPVGPPAMGLTLRRYPLACRATVQVRDGQPLRVESARLSGVVVACHGPWKSGGDWWHRGRGWERTEWDVELLNHGLFRLVETEQGWSVEGYYD
jgi:protein ImuB